MTKLTAVQDQLRKIYASPKKLHQKKANYVKKVSKPPSDNETIYK
jgi:hypothetical protein